MGLAGVEANEITCRNVIDEMLKLECRAHDNATYESSAHWKTLITLIAAVKEILVDLRNSEWTLFSETFIETTFQYKLFALKAIVQNVSDFCDCDEVELRSFSQVESFYNELLEILTTEWLLQLIMAIQAARRPDKAAAIVAEKLEALDEFERRTTPHCGNLENSFANYKK